MGFFKTETETKKTPVQKYLEWRSMDASFAYYDKEQAKNVLVEPFKFIVLEQFSTIKGFNDSEQSGIYANEVSRLNEPLNVRTFSGKAIAEGLYKEIKGKVKQAGGRYTRSVYVMTPDGDVLNFQLKGAALSSWMDFEEKVPGKSLDNHWVTIGEPLAQKKGVVNYSVPTFTLGEEITDKETNTIESNGKELFEYLHGRNKTEAETVPQPEYNEDDVPF